MEGTKCGVLNHKQACTPTADKSVDKQSVVTCSTWSRDEAIIYSGGFDGSSINVWKVGKGPCVLPWLLRLLRLLRLRLRLANALAPAPPRLPPSHQIAQ